jgi:hypothetical protein
MSRPVRGGPGGAGEGASWGHIIMTQAIFAKESL